MATIESLRKSISDMTNEELTEAFRNIRLSRRTSKANLEAKRQASAGKSKLKAAADAKKAISGVAALSPEAAAELLKQLEAK